MVLLARDGKEPPSLKDASGILSFRNLNQCEGSKRLTPSLNPEPWFSNFECPVGAPGEVVKNVHPRALLKT